MTSKADLAKLERELSLLTEEAAQANAEAERLQKSRHGVLISGTDDDLKTHDEALARSLRTTERTEARCVECARRLEAARLENVALERAEVRAAVEKRADAAIATLKKLFSSFRKNVRELASTIADAEQDIGHVNNRLIDGEEPIASLEARLGKRRLLPRKIISEEVVELWVYEQTGHVIREQNDVRTQGGGRGVIYSESVQGKTPHSVVLRKFMRREFLPETRLDYDYAISEAIAQIVDLVTLEVEDARQPKIEMVPLPQTADEKA